MMQNRKIGDFFVSIAPLKAKSYALRVPMRRFATKRTSLKIVNMATIFSIALTKAREEAGFPTAYRFYHDSGGIARLKMSYRQYLMVEQGKRLPSFEKLHIFLLTLHLMPTTPPANRLVTAWLKIMAGERSYDQVLKPLIATEIANHHLPPIHEAMKRQLAAKRYYITPGQLRAILTDFNTFLCHIAMTNDTGAWSAESLAKNLKLKVPAVAEALQTLTKAKILKRVKKDHYICPMAAMITTHPHLDTVAPELARKYMCYYRKMKTSGTSTWIQSTTVRADFVDFHKYIPLLAQDIETAESYGITKQTPTSALYTVEAKITKLLDF